MREIRRSTALSLAAATLLALVAFAAAPVLAESHEEKMPGPIADLWLVWPKAGHEAQFATAIQAHLAWRKQAGEGWTWSGFQPLVGTDLTYYVFRSGDHEWADLDAQGAWEVKTKAGAEFNKSIMPHVDRLEHYITEQDFANSHWADAEDYQYFWVEDHVVKSGHQQDVREALGVLTKGLVDGGWTGSWAVSRPVGGTGGVLTLAFPYRTFAEMKEPEPGFVEILTKGMGSAEAAGAAMGKWDASIESTTTTIYVYRPDLSTKM